MATAQYQTDPIYRDNVFDGVLRALGDGYAVLIQSDDTTVNVSIGAQTAEPLTYERADFWGAAATVDGALRFALGALYGT